MTVKDAMDLVSIYDKYEFPVGIKICDTVLYKAFFRDEGWEFRASCHQKSPDPNEVDKFVQIIALSNQTNLRKTFFWGRQWLNSIFDTFSKGPQVYFPLTVTHIEQLVPTFIRDNELSDSNLAEAFYNDYDDFDDERHLVEVAGHEALAEYLDGDGEDIGIDLKSFIWSILKFADKDFENPLFPELFLARVEIKCVSLCAVRNINLIKVVFPSSDHELSGYYRKNDCGDYFHTEDRVFAEVYRCPFQREWRLSANGRTLFVCRVSQFAFLPPKTGWIEAENFTDDQESGIVPTVKYKMR